MSKITEKVIVIEAELFSDIKIKGHIMNEILF